jgi:hypothetical protein
MQGFYDNTSGIRAKINEDGSITAKFIKNEYGNDL